MRVFEKLLRETLEGMDVPARHLALTPVDLKWLLHNLAAHSPGHVDLPFATHLVTTLLIVRDQEKVSEKRLCKS